jgi:hypothetical protein
MDLWYLKLGHKIKSATEWRQNPRTQRARQVGHLTGTFGGPLHRLCSGGGGGADSLQRAKSQTAAAIP